MNCEDVRRHWNLYHDSEGTPDLFQAINGHLEECTDCAEWYRRQEFVEGEIVRRVAAGEPTPELWESIVIAQRKPEPSGASRKLLLWMVVALTACLLLATGLKFWPQSQQPDAVETDLAQLSSQWHRDLSTGTQPVDYRSSSDLEVERYLRDRVEFPVRCPPRKDSGFFVSGAGICQLDGQKTAYLVGTLDGNDVSIFILSREALKRFPQQNKVLKQAKDIDCQNGDYRTTMAAIDRNVVLVVGRASCARQERVVRAYGTYPHDGG